MCSPLPPNSPFPPRRRGFSLVETVLALGIVSFSLTSLLALLPAGLGSVRNAADETAISSIVRAVRAELNQADFEADIKSWTTPQVWHFSEAGNRTAVVGERFFQVSLATGAAGPGPVETMPVDLKESARNVTLSISYPSFAPAASRTNKTLTILVARQSSRPTPGK